MRHTKTTRNKVKGAIRRLARMTGLTIAQVRPTFTSGAHRAGVVNLVRNSCKFEKQTAENIGLECDFLIIHRAVWLAIPFTVQSTASTIAEIKKMRLDMLAPLPESISPLTSEQMKRMMQSIKRIVDESPKFVIVTTPSKVNENSFFDQVRRGEAQPTLTWADAAVTLQMSDHLEEEAKKLLTVRRGKMRGEHLVKADPTILYNIPLSLKDLSDEHPGTTEPHQGTDPVPGDT